MLLRAVMRPLAAVFAAGFLVALARSAGAQPSSADFTVSGTSTIRSWSCAVTGVVKMTPGTGSSQAVPGLPGGVQAVTVTVPVKSFKCPDDEMTQHLLEAMKADKYPEIVYRLERYAVTGNQAEATGSITITGVTESISFPVTLESSGQRVQVAGNTRINMTKFGVDPPIVMLGMLKVGPQVRIAFQAIVAQ